MDERAAGLPVCVSHLTRISVQYPIWAMESVLESHGPRDSFEILIVQSPTPVYNHSQNSTDAAPGVSVRKEEHGTRARSHAKDLILFPKIGKTRASASASASRCQESVVVVSPNLTRERGAARRAWRRRPPSRSCTRLFSLSLLWAYRAFVCVHPWAHVSHFV